MGRRALTRGGLAAALALLAIYVLLGGEVDLGGSDSSPTTTERPPQTQTQQAPTDQGPDSEAPAPTGEISEPEAQEIARVLALIDAGGPFPHEQDGSTFSNREGLLPQQPNGYYREYTCETPGSDDRGARRLVVGQAGEIYYTADHYDSFTRIEREDYR